jgi:hypothetical protein
MAGAVQCTFSDAQVRALERALTERLNAAKRVAGLTLEEEAKVIMENSWRQIPVWTGAAMSTGFVRSSVDANGDAVVSVGYEGDTEVNPVTGRPVSDYLLRPHEDLSIHHINGEAKFLEDPLLEYVQTLRVRLMDILQYNMKYGGKG